MPPCDWNINNLACVNTWGALRARKQLKANFAKSGALLMSELEFWDENDPDSNRTSAKLLATDMDGIFTLVLLAKYEPGYNYAKAMQELTQALLRAQRSVCELALVVDEAYRFRAEVK